MIKVEYLKDDKKVMVELTQNEVQHLWNACINYHNGLKTRDWAYNLGDVYTWVMVRAKENETHDKVYSSHGQGD